VRYAPPVILALLAAALLAGCSGQTKSNSADDFQGDKKAVAQVVDDLSNAGSDKDAKEICTTIFAPEVAEKLNQGNRDCQDVVKEQLKDANAFGLDVKSVDVSGTTATASVESKYDGEDKLQTLRFRKDGQAWRLVGFAQ
jgi:outer membrane PBP1 activator LpoA protein